MLRRRHLLAIAAVALIGAAGTPLCAQTPMPRVPSQARASEPRTMFSATRRFMVTGSAPAAGAELAQWADEVAHRLEGVCGPLPAERGALVELARVEPEAGAPGRVLRQQAFVDGRLEQRLVLSGVERLDQEDALEGLTWLLLNRYAIGRQDAEARRAGPAHVPDWLAVGVAQNLYPELRDRNVRVGLTRWARGELSSPDELVGDDVMPEGRWAQKADAALFVAWLQSESSWSALWQQAVDGMAAGKALPADWWLARALSSADARDGERQWELWIAGLRDAQRTLGGDDEQNVAALRAALAISPTDCASVGGPVDAGTIDMTDLLRARRDKWAKRLANMMSLRIKLEGVGQGREIQEVAGLYATFLDAITGRGAGYSGGLFGRGPSTRQLSALLQRADSALIRLETDARARSEYLSRVSAQLFSQPAGGEAEPATTDAVHRYLDEVEADMVGAPK